MGDHAARRNDVDNMVGRYKPSHWEVNESESEAKSVGPEFGVTDHADVVM
jgi:hypothetical protein